MAVSETQKHFQRLFSLSREIATLGSIGRLLHWDQETHMPPAGAPARAEQTELLAGIVHKKRISRAFEQALSALVDLESGKLHQPGLSREQRAAVREWRRDFLLATSLPPRWVKAFAKATSETVEMWRKAREASDFSQFAPGLERVLGLWREKSELLGYRAHPYDAHLDEYEPGATTASLTKLFDELKEPLRKLRREVHERQVPKADFLKRHYSQPEQMEFVRFLLRCTGFTPERGALDLTTHPFCTSLHPTDGRVTTRVNEQDPMENFLAALHEGGHYLYEANLPEETWGSPLSEAASMAVHESQSRWWETLVGKSKPFWQFALPHLKKVFPKQLQGVELDAFVQAANILTSTPIRIHADEVSYCLHVILRFDLEREMISGRLQVADLPHAWNAGMKELLDLSPHNDAAGCLQDIHWAGGYCGYFPTYALGNLYAAQFFQTFSADHKDWGKRIAEGDFTFMRDWLKSHIHQYGRQFHSADLVRKVTGKAPSVHPYLHYLQTKYRALFR